MNGTLSKLVLFEDIRWTDKLSVSQKVILEARSSLHLPTCVAKASANNGTKTAQLDIADDFFFVAHKRKRCITASVDLGKGRGVYVFAITRNKCAVSEASGNRIKELQDLVVAMFVGQHLYASLCTSRIGKRLLGKHKIKAIRLMKTWTKGLRSTLKKLT
jgi:hypothetical protein